MVHASLFSGIGGPEVAAEMMGWRNAFHCEINPFGRAVLDYWFPESKSYEDITKTDFREWRGKIDVLTGGFPCQPFSYAGQRRGADDSRYLWPEMLRAIDEIRPTWVVGENVAGLATMVEGGVLSPLGNEGTLFGEVDGVQRYGLRQSFTIERICRDLEGLGYSVQPLLIPAAAVGAPHRRDRIFILAYDDHADRRDDEGGAGKDEGTGEGQRLCKRHEIRVAGEPGDVRPEICNLAADTASDGRHGDTREDGEKRCAGTDGERPAKESADGIRFRGIAGLFGEQRAASDTAGRGYRASGADGEPQGNGGAELPLTDKRREQAKRLDGLSALLGDTSDTLRGRRGEVHEHLQPKLADGAEPFSDGRKRDAAGARWANLDPERRWANFPSISPVHRGNDGLPFPLDDLAIPASKWRTESLKAYGNAIVPQVMYEIFRAIEIVEREKL